MSTPVFVNFLVAQTPSQPKATQSANNAKTPNSGGSVWMYSSGGLFLLLVAFAVFFKLQTDKLKKQVKFETFRVQGLQKKLNLALKTIGKMERNPDLVHSREFNLDYLRLRMDEEQFHFAIVNQLKIKVKEKISVALRSSASQGKSSGIVGISSTGRKVDSMFDVEYTTEREEKREKRVLFRIQIKLMKLPTQSTSTTINQIIDCIETYLSPTGDHDTWQPTIQGRIVNMHWDQQAKPTPLLVLEQLNEGANVSFRTQRKGGAPPPKRQQPKSKLQKARKRPVKL